MSAAARSSRTSKPKLVCFGAGGHASVVVDAALVGGLPVAGYVVGPTPAPLSVGPYDLPILAIDDERLAASLAKARITHFIIGFGSLTAADVGRRRAAFERGVALGLQPMAVLHPRAIVAASARFGAGTFIAAGVVVNAYAEIGRNVIVNTGAQIDHHCRIGDHASIAPGAVLGGNVVVGTAAHINIGAVVLQSIEIGADATVAAGALVMRNVAAGSVVVGRPAKPR